ncbi:hypothetical protein TNCV_1271261 [Trichonephila clavipes]|nr:hypothetical protein TNCV_1271261 [Trichonephila clavipes]
MERGEDQISSSIIHMQYLTLLTSSKYNELNAWVTLSEWTKTALPKMSSMSNQLAHEERQLRWIDDLEKDLPFLVLKTMRTLAKKAGLENAS